ncbi:MAG: hypothetical protein KatS3mg032_1821 [Cyclobacteriaceae bacterium]|nr:MAG: hypothetical protein KatS3mg032_1821 [Cyclobacteriaceae bacterium]
MNLIRTIPVLNTPLAAFHPEKLPSTQANTAGVSNSDGSDGSEVAGNQTGGNGDAGNHPEKRRNRSCSESGLGFQFLLGS